MRVFMIALSLLALSNFAHASDTQVEPYRYGAKLDIAHVVSIQTPTSETCQPVTAVMTYEDSNGEIRKMSYTVVADNCHNQN